MAERSVLFYELNFMFMLFQEYPPSSNENRLHYNAGLGQRRITFVRDREATNFTEKLEEEYPKMANIGGFELLRTAGSRSAPLEVITPPQSGYNVDHLANGYLGQAICYIRPIQTTLSTETEEVSTCTLILISVNNIFTRVYIMCVSQWRDNVGLNHLQSTYLSFFTYCDDIKASLILKSRDFNLIYPVNLEHQKQYKFDDMLFRGQLYNMYSYCGRSLTILLCVVNEVGIL